jgi:ABC-2 type transport system ATP-binding protein
MDEAERCHRLAILERGRLVAEGNPHKMITEINAIVVQIETDTPAAAQKFLARQDRVRSVAQMGTRLHVLLDITTSDPVGYTQAILNEQGIRGVSRLIEASLEDVFVAATGFRKG